MFCFQFVLLLMGSDLCLFGMQNDSMPDGRCSARFRDEIKRQKTVARHLLIGDINVPTTFSLYCGVNSDVTY